MGRDPLVSVIIPTHNCGPHLSNAIKSVLKQTFANFELVIVDDDSTDDTPEIVQRFASVDPRVRYVRQSPNRGPSAARNTGIRASAGNLIAFLDADDRWSRRKLELQVDALSGNEYDVCGVGCRRVGSGGRVRVEVKRPPYTGDGLYRELLFRNSIPGSASAVMLRRRCLDFNDLFDEGLRTVEDRDLWIRLAARVPFTFVNVPLVSINHARPDSASRNHARMARGREAFLRKRERDMPARFRPLLPRLRRRSYLSIAKKYSAVDDPGNCRRYCLRAIFSSMAVDADLWKAVRVLGASLVPVSARIEAGMPWRDHERS